MSSTILIAGGARDPNLIALIEAAQARGLDISPLLVGHGENPSITWQLNEDELWINGQPLAVRATFLRRDVFHASGQDGDYRASAWFATIEGWLASCPGIKMLNRGYLGRYTNKLYALRLARTVGLRVPDTVVTNAVMSVEAFNVAGEVVAKPVTGGGYCRSAKEFLTGAGVRNGATATPAIVQRRLQSPDLRIYWVRGTCIAFRIQSDTADYREASTRDYALIDVLPPRMVAALGQLMERLGMDWCAADFKACPDTGELTFLEINSNPMFSVLDNVGSGAITAAILNVLSSE